MIIYVIATALLCVIGTAHAHPSLACTNAPHASFVRNPRGCPYYYVCMNGTAISQRCPDELHFDVQGKCNFPEEVDCGLCSNYGFQAIRYPGSCRRYIECNNSIRTERECSEGLYFDTERGSCNLEQLVDCAADPEPTDTPPVTRPPASPTPTQTAHPPTYPPTNHTGTPTAHPPTRPPRPTHSTNYPTGTQPTWTPSRPTNHPNGTDCPPPNRPHPCYRSSTVFLAHESDCNKYYFCFFSTTITRRCPSNLHWNQLDNNCDLPSNAHCIHNARRRKVDLLKLFGPNGVALKDVAASSDE